jgi:hypothetical protein
VRARPDSDLLGSGSAGDQTNRVYIERRRGLDHNKLTDYNKLIL